MLLIYHKDILLKHIKRKLFKITASQLFCYLKPKIFSNKNNMDSLTAVSTGSCSDFPLLPYLTDRASLLPSAM